MSTNTPQSWDRHNPEISALPADSVSQILATIASSGLRSVHYTGAADEGLLRALIGHQPKLEISVMDIPDRWGASYSFWYDERDFGNCPPRDRPDWLEGIPFYQEGAPEHEIAIRDWPWDTAHQLRQIVAFTGRQPPSIMILAGLALLYTDSVQVPVECGVSEWREILRPMNFQHPMYHWRNLGDFWLGHWKDGEISAYTRRHMSKSTKTS